METLCRAKRESALYACPDGISHAVQRSTRVLDWANTAPVTPNRLSVPGGIPIGDNFNVRPLRDGFRVGGTFEFE